MDLRTVRRSIIEPALLLLPARMESPQAVVMLLAIGLQESRFEYRRQMGNGPAKSFWQAEQGGGMVTGLLRYRVEGIRDLATGLCAVRGVAPAAPDVWNAIERDDILAAGLARLLLYTDPARLPALGDEAGAWDLYLRTWRPGAYARGDATQRAALRKKWAANYAAALEAAQ
ncbi:hypothetical protein ACNFIA_22290 [Pseudomonas sp. NY15437]|uniref:hypothetical protein n=1 Tax=Pseudomonas sp. NY15437 TaxID=3400360 RepID=UPI003A86798A